ncbi:hypothetical protein EV122DRAFT_277201 [Schizophyllum commune]
MSAITGAALRKWPDEVDLNLTYVLRPATPPAVSPSGLLRDLHLRLLSSFSRLRHSTPMDAFAMAAIPDIEEIVDVPEDFESGGGTTGVYCVVA